MPEERITAHRLAAVAFVAPRVGFGLICVALILHLRPEAPGSRVKLTNR
jgi:hypothetical protein